MRDLGGLPTADGRRLRAARIYRSDDPFLFSSEDIAALASWGIDSVVDLRTAEEVSERGSSVWEQVGVEHHVVPLVEEIVMESDRGKYVDPEPIATFYLAMLEQGRAGQRKLWEAISRGSRGKQVIHCASGRDRTGIVVAILLGFLGVPDDQIVEDYALSAAGMERMLAWLEEHNREALRGLIPDEPARRAFVVTPPDAMRLTLARFREQYGDFLQYAESTGIDHLLPSLRENLLE